MKEHHLRLAKYWASTSSAHHAAGFHHMAALFARYSTEHLAKAEEYED